MSSRKKRSCTNDQQKLKAHKDEVFLMDSLIIGKLCECVEKFSISAKIVIQTLVLRYS